MKAIIYNITKFTVEISPLEIGFGIIKYIKIAKSPLIFISVIFYILNSRIKFIYTLD